MLGDFMVEAGKWAIINADGIVENVILWDGITEWNPCHEDDQVILIIENEPTIGEQFVE